MKKGLLFGIFMIVSVVLLAQENASAYDAGSAVAQHETHVTPAQALNVGYTFMRTGSGSSTRGGTHGSVSKQAMQLVYTGQTYDSLTGTTTDCYYVFALQPKGFVIVAADDRVEPILGYSYDNDFAVANMPDHVRAWLGSYERQIEAVAKNNIQAEPATETKWTRLKSGLAMNSVKSGGSSVGPLLTTTWDQELYYNSLCPADAGNPTGHVPTGCVATATAQIINYWGYPAHGRGTHSYESNYGTLTVNYDSANYDYTLMPEALTSASTTQEVNAVATLMRDCGIAMDMGYSTNSSADFSDAARVALVTFFRYNPNLSLAYRGYFSNSEWDSLLHADLDNNRPIYYAGGGASGAHAFVCDGYDANGYYHFNLGWGGSANGWYLTNPLNINGLDLSGSQDAILGIVPDSSSNVILCPGVGTSTFTVDEPLEFCNYNEYNVYDMPSTVKSVNTVNFIASNSDNRLATDIINFNDQFTSLYNDYYFSIYDGNGILLRDLYTVGNIGLSPFLSNDNTLNAAISSVANFKLSIYQTQGCIMVSNVNSTIESSTVHLSWTDYNEATQWQIEYGIKGFELGSGTTITTTTNMVTINNLQPLTEYDFYILSVCDNNYNNLWKKTTLKTEAPCWQDIVTSQPPGYVYDAATNSVEISTAEELTWWAKTGNGVDGHLAADIDLSGYNWRPTELSNRNFNGHGHIITNAYIKESSQNGGFFSTCTNGYIIENLGLTNSYIRSNLKAGGLCCVLHGTIRNCYVSNCSIDGDGTAGGLVGECYGSVLNSFANVNVVGNWRIGLMIGYSSQGTIRNCYAAGDLSFHQHVNYIAGVVAYADNSEISNCYSINTVGDNTPLDVIGVNINSNITNSSTFAMSDSIWTLLTPVAFDDLTETDLLSALNRHVELYNDSLNYTWAADSSNINGGYPIFGNKHIVQCTNVSDLLVQQVTVNNNYAVTVSWTENGTATQWLIGYRHHDRPDTSYIYVTAIQNPDTLFIPLGYTYDFNVRAICNDNNISGWSETYTLTVDLPYWTDIVTTQPAGYVEDANGNVEISSAEGLAWFAVKTNGFHNQEQNSFAGKTVTLKSDINIENYRWYPTGDFSGLFDGENHQISHIYMNGDIGGLFGNVRMGSVKNVILNGGLIICDEGGGLISYAYDCYEISNCHSSATVYSNSNVGSLCGNITNSASSTKTTISNCSASGTVYGRKYCGNLIGIVNGNVEIRNCYATGDVNAVNGETGWYGRGGLIGFFAEASAYNCFSTGSVEDPMSYDYHGKVLGNIRTAHFLHYLYSQDDVNMGWDLMGNNDCEDVSNTSLFHHNDGTNTLLTSVSINGAIYYDLLDALNAWVIQQNDSTLKLWTLDSNTGYPIFGDYFVPSCYNPTNLTVSQETVAGDSTIKTRLGWTQEGEPNHWEVLYVATGQTVTSGNIGTIVPVNSNPCVLAGIPIGNPLDFYVRSICGEGDTSNWYGPVTYLPDKLHWTDVVTSQPEGYQEDANGNVYISSAEGLSWLSSIVNGLNGAQCDFCFEGKQIFLLNDIDLSAYRWTSIGKDNLLNCISFNGNDHVVSGLYCNELSGYQGLFGLMSGNISNLQLTGCYVYSTVKSYNGSSSIGGLVGCSVNNKIVNCMVMGNVCGGGIAGTHTGNHNIENSCFIGNNITSGNSVEICETSSGDGKIVNCYVVNTDDNTTSVRNYFGATSNSYFIGDGNTWTLSTPPFINGAFRNDLVEALNAWVDANNTDGLYHHWETDTMMVNKGYPVFAPVAYPTIVAQDTVVATGYYSWHGMVFTSDTVITDTIPNPNGYDSVVTHHIIITPAPLFEITIDTCSNYIWNGITYTETGDYVQTFPSTAGSDSIAILHLIINPLTGVDIQHTCDKSYTWIDGVTYIANTNTATYRLQTVEGCDSIVTLHLSFQKTYGDTTVVTCPSFDWYEHTNLTQSGDYKHTFTNAAGCDSIVTLHLVLQTHGDTTAVTCPGFDWYEHTNLTQSGDYTHTFITADGCDSIVTLHLTVNDSYWTDVVTSQPEGYQEDGNGNLYISSAEGLAWLASVANELNGAHSKSFNQITLTNDVDLSAYRWTPIGNLDHIFHCASFNGNNHVIFGLCCNNKSQEIQGLFGVMAGDVHNLTLTRCKVHGQAYVGAIVGYSNSNNIYNCMVSGDIWGYYCTAEFIGFSSEPVKNSCFIGTVTNPNYSCAYGGLFNCYSVNNHSKLYYNTTNSDFSGSGNTWTLNTPPYINGAYHSDLVDALNAWVDANDTDGKYLRWVADTAMINGGYPMFVSATKPTVTTNMASDITTSTATCGGNVTDDGGSLVTARGICWSTSANPTIADAHTSDGMGTGAFTSLLTGLEPNTTYHVRAYAINSVGTAYGEEVTFTTAAPSTTPPTVTTIAVSNITVTTATSGGIVTSDGGASVTERGICWSTSQNPTIADAHTSDGMGTGAFTSLLTGLEPNTTYHVRAYATNSAGTAYGEEVTFTTAAPSTTPPTVTTIAVSNITAATATSGGNVTSDGGAAVTARGVCWSTSANPTIADAHTSDGMGTGAFTSLLTGLEPNTTYYVRAYATNSAGTAYGEEVTFTTTTAGPTPPTFSCGDSLIIGGNIYTTQQYGSQCWMMQNLRTASGSEQFDYPDVLQACPTGWHLPDNSDWGTLGSNLPSSPVNFGDGNYWTSTFMPWQDAEGNQFTLIAPPYVQSSSVSFTGIACEVHDAALYNCIDVTPIAIRCLRDDNASATLPAVTTDTVFNITATSATCIGNVTDDGGSEVTERGICWSTSTNPTVVVAGAGTGTFTINLSDLTPNTSYLVRAYATNSAGTAYGEEVTFTTAAPSTTPPTVSTIAVSNITATTATSGGNVTSDGGASVTERGICWSTSQNPTVADAHTSDGTGTGAFTSQLTSLDPSTTYYLRAYAMNSEGTAYGEEVMFTTASPPTTLPTVTTNTVINITATTATCGGNVTSDGGASVTERGICWSTSQNPTVADAHTSDGIGTGMFTSTMTGLTPVTTYYVRAYATNSAGTAYGEEVTFTTETSGPTPPTYSCGDNLIVGGNIYTTNQYGSQCWMMQNLRNASGSEQFDYPAVLQACPTGWHLPDNSDWGSLGSNLPSSPVDFGDGDYWASNTMPWQDQEGNQYTLFISPASVRSNSVTILNNGIACEVNDAIHCDCIIDAYCLSFRCVRDENASTMLPIVKTDTVINVTATSATCVGDVLTDGGTDVTERGFCWNALQDSTVAVAVMGSGTGTFAFNLSDLTPNTTYLIRAYATSSAGTAYGEEVTFTTECNPVNITISSDKEAICEGECATLHAFGADSYIWSTGENSSSITDCPTATTSYSVTGFDLYGCESATSFTLMVINLPATPVVTVDNGTVCIGGEITLSVTNPDTDPSTSYTWYRDGAVIPNATQAIIVDYPTIVDNDITNHVYSVVASHYNSSCVSGESEPTVVTVNLTSNTELLEIACDSYTWNDSVYTESGNYTRIFTAANGCDSIVTLHLTVNYSTQPTVSTSTVSNITSNTATCGGNITANDCLIFSERGVCWSTSHNPTTTDAHTSDGTGPGAFTSIITDLTPNTTYYVRAYSVNSVGTVYGEEVTFTTAAPSTTPPTVTTNTIINITATTATCGGNVTSDGGAEVTERGVCWNTSHNPTIADSHTSDGTGTGAFTSQLTSLEANTTYHVRAYATNSEGTAYGEEVTFTTETAGPTPQTYSCGDNLIVGGNIYTTHQYGSQCWMTRNLRNASGGEQFDYPDVLQACPTGWHLPDDSEWYTLGSNLPSSPVNFDDGNYWTSTFMPWQDADHNQFTLISPPYVQSNNVTYTVSACEIHDAAQCNCIIHTCLSVRCIRDENDSATLPTVTTDTVINITASSATCVGDVFADGGTDVTERGICWNALQDSTVSVAVMGSGTGAFAVNLSDLTPNTTYLIRAYATSSAGTAYGEEVTFTTADGSTPTTITCGYQLVVGSDSYTTYQYGTKCWMTQNLRNPGGNYFFDYPDVLQACPIGWHLPDDSEWSTLGIFLPTSSVNFGDGDYWTSTFIPWQDYVGNQFTLISPPYVNSNSVSFSGGACEVHDAAQGNCQVHTELSVRCIRDDTTATPPTVSTVTVIDITATTATSGGNVIADGGATVTERGVCWSTSANPTVANSHTSDGTGTGVFTSQLIGLEPSTTYHVRAYSTNRIGTTYGEEVTFTTGCPPVDVTITSDKAAICEGECTTLHASGADSYIWSTGENISTITVCPTITTTYSVTGFDLYGCESAASFTLMVNDLPATPFVTVDNASVCDGGEVSLSISNLDSNPSTSYTWSRNGIVIPGTTQAIMVDNPTAVGGETTNYAYTVMASHSNSGCVSGISEPTVVTVNVMNNTELFETACNSYEWNDSVYTQSGNYTQTFTNDNGCDSIVTLHLTVNYTTTTTVTTGTVNDITPYSAICGGNVIADGCAEVTERGVCWSTSQNPTVADSHTSDSIGVGTFSSQLIGLEPNTTYHVRAYATNGVGTAYGEELMFTTASQFTCGENLVVGYYSYTTMNYGSQCWMTQNLRNTSSNYFDYPDVLQACPTGWHLPDNNDWNTLGIYLPSSSVYFGNGDYWTSTLIPYQTYQGEQFTLISPPYVNSNSVSFSSGTACEVHDAAQGICQVHTELSVRCLRNENAYAALPTVTTQTASNIMPNTATCGGIVTADGGATVTERGVCWSVSENPTIADSHTINGGGAGAFTSQLTGLELNITYHVRAYATNSAGTAYGEDVTFTTDLCGTLSISISGEDGISHICESEPVTLIANVEADGFTPENLHYTWYEDGQVRDNMTFGLGDTNEYAEYWASQNSIYSFSVVVTYGAHLSCVAQSEERYVRVYPQPATPVVMVDQTSIYDGGQVVLSVINSDLNTFSYTWYKNGVVIPGATGTNLVDNPTTVGGETTQYVYTVEVSHLYTGCTSEPSEPTVVTVRVTPTATVTAEGNTMLCEGETVTLHVDVTPANDSYSYQWYVDGSLIPGATSADYVVSKHARYTAYNFTVRVSASGGLDILVPGPAITVMPAPFVTALASEISICEGGTSTLTAWVAGSSANYGYNFQWFRSIPHPDGTSDTNLVGTNATYTTSSNVPVNNYTYWVEVTSEYGCSSQSNPLTLTVKPNPSVTISGNTTFCEGGYTTLYANVTPDQEASYVWYKDGVEMFFSMPSIPVTDGGVYTVAATVYGCSSQSDPITLTVKPNPSVFISGGTTFCEGGSTTLYANVTPDQDATYVWYKNGAEMALYTPSITVTDGGTYTVEATANGCSDLAGYVTVTVEENPQLHLSATETNICIGGHTTITANAVNWSDGNIFYSWSDSYGSASSYDFSFEQAGLHTITVTATNTAYGCQGTNSITINVNDLPETPVVTVNQATVFDGGQVTLTVANPIPNAIYTWYKNGELIPFTNQSSHTEYLMTIDGETTIYTYAVVAALDISGCVSAVSDNTEVTVFPTPVANVTVNGLTIFCEGSSTTLHVDVTPLNGPTYAYQWYKDGVLIPGATSADYVVAEPARTTSYNFHVVVSANGSYNVTAYAPAVTVVSSPTVVATISENTVCVGGTATLTAMVSGGIGGLNGLNNYSYQWFRNADSTTELVGTNYTYTTAGDEPAGTYAYWLAISNGYGCNSQSESVMFTVVDDPTVTITPAAGYNETVCNGGSTVLQANATGGFGEFSYQWYKNGFLLIGETNQTLAINDLYYGVNYTYTVSVTQSGASCATISAPQAVIVNALSYTTLFETACEDYTWNGVTYAQTGEYTQTFTGANGCDSVVTLYLIVNHANTGDTTAVANDMFDWYEHTYLTQSGDYTHVFTNQNGCDSVVTLHLTVNNPTISVQDTVMTAGYFIWHGMVFTSDTVLTEIIPVLDGYDSLVVYHVFVTPTPLTVLNVDTCVSYTLNGQTYTETGDYVQTFPVSGGMDSVVVLYLTIFPADSADFTETACESFTWEGTTYTTSGDYTKTLTNANGCDSVVTLHLTLFPADSTDFAETACEVFTWDGTTYTTSGDYTKTFSNVNGCDSTVTLHLTIFPADSADFAETACESFTWNGTTYTSSGDYTQTFTNANGCDSTVTLHLTVNFPDNSEYSETACDSYTWEGTTYTQSGDYTQTFTNANGCDSIVTLHLTVNHGTHNIETETACESYEWHGATYTTSGTYTYEYNNADGCASVDTLHLTINFAQSAEFAVTTADSCYSWNGHLYCESGDYTQTLTAANGCDSTVTLHLTITVGIDDHNLGASMTVYPNPTNGIVNVQCTMNNVQVGTMEYHVFDAYGKLVDVVGMNANGSSEQTAHIDLSGFANGVYFVKAVADGNVVAVRKVVKR